MLGPGSEVGRYVIKKKLAEGGMAEIFLASAQGPEGFSKDVVIKVVKEFLSVDAQFVQMFIAEARLASLLNHANVVQIFDFGKHEDSHYLAMEYVRGASLWDLRRRAKDTGAVIPPALAAEIISQVARGLHYAHSLANAGQKMNVVHRDVTPHNVLLSFDGAVKLTDFGIAKATTTHTVPGMLKGKFAYMAPEQARGEKVDARTDIFALGIVTWELLTGGRLFDGDTDLGILRAVQESLIPPPSRLNPQVPQELSDIVMKALARDLPERFQSAFEFEKALANWVRRSAASVDETDSGAFLRQLFQQEYERANAPEAPESTQDDDFGDGSTHVRKNAERTQTATPAPRPRGVMDDDDAPSARTEEFEEAPKKPQTAAARILKRPSRKLEPLPVNPTGASNADPVPNIIVRPSAMLPSPADVLTGSQSATQSADTDEVPPIAPKSYAPLMIGLGVLIALLAGGLFFVLRENTKEPIAAVQEPPAVVEEKQPEAKPEPVVEKVAIVDPTPKPEDADVAPPAAKTETKSPAPVAAKKMGTLSLRAVPFATVTVQGRQYEVTGVKTLPLPVGSYEVLFTHPKKTEKQRATVKLNETTPLSFSAN